LAAINTKYLTIRQVLRKCLNYFNKRGLVFFLGYIFDFKTENSSGDLPYRDWYALSPPCIKINLDGKTVKLLSGLQNRFRQQKADKKTPLNPSLPSTTLSGFTKTTP
jgi:hypothetical protein